MKLIASTIDEFFTHADPAFLDDMISLDRIFTPLCPPGTRKLYTLDSITMLGYGEVTLTTKARGPEIWPIVSIAPQIHNISVYVNGDENGTSLVTAYKHALGKVSCGKYCVRVTKLEKINTAALTELARKAFAQSR